MVNNELIAIRGNRIKWLNFSNEVRKNKKKVWDVLEKFIDEYMVQNP